MLEAGPSSQFMAGESSLIPGIPGGRADLLLGNDMVSGPVISSRAAVQLLPEEQLSGKSYSMTVIDETGVQSDVRNFHLTTCFFN
jgi:hypothetical protein